MGTECGLGLFGCQQVALFVKCLCTFFISFESSGQLLIVNPLVAHQLQLVATLGIGQILVGSLDKLVGQCILLLQLGVGQRGIDGVLCQFGAFLTTQSFFHLLANIVQLCIHIVNHFANPIHLLNQRCILWNLASHLVRQVNQTGKLLRA